MKLLKLSYDFMEELGNNKYRMTLETPEEFSHPSTLEQQFMVVEYQNQKNKASNKTNVTVTFREKWKLAYEMCKESGDVTVNTFFLHGFDTFVLGSIAECWRNAANA